MGSIKNMESLKFNKEKDLEEWKKEYSRITKDALDLIFVEVYELEKVNIGSIEVIKKITKEMYESFDERFNDYIGKGYLEKKIYFEGTENYVKDYFKNKKIGQDQIIELWEYDIVSKDISWKYFMEVFEEEFDGFEDSCWLKQFPTEIDFEKYKVDLFHKIKRYKKIYVDGVDGSDLEGAMLVLKIPLTGPEKKLKKSGIISKTKMKEEIGREIIDDTEKEGHDALKTRTKVE